jgi:hypothetical protein
MLGHRSPVGMPLQPYGQGSGRDNKSHFLWNLLGGGSVRVVDWLDLC